MNICTIDTTTATISSINRTFPQDKKLYFDLHDISEKTTNIKAANPKASGIIAGSVTPATNSKLDNESPSNTLNISIKGRLGLKLRIMTKMIVRMAKIVNTTMSDKAGKKNRIPIKLLTNVTLIDNAYKGNTL
jgi:hypothetical protein